MAIGDNFMWDPDGVIKGETSDSFFSRCKAFEVLEWVFKVDNGTDANYKKDEEEEGEDQKKPKVSSYNPKTGVMPGKLKFHEIQIEKVVDSSSTLLYKACCLEDPIPSLIMVSRKAGGDALNYLQYIFREVHVTSIQWKGGGAERAKETVTLDFKAMGMQYIQQTAEGRATGASDWRWNRVKETNTLNIDDGSPAPPFIAAYSTVPGSSKK
jgi:type VI secretion system Hcp family effector